MKKAFFLILSVVLILVAGALVYLSGKEETSTDVDVAITNVLQIREPKNYQFFQRNLTTNSASFNVHGRFIKTINKQVQVRLISPQLTTEWQNIAKVNSNFSYSFNNVKSGQYNLEVRILGGDPNKIVVKNISIGDIFAIAGQSNASGRTKIKYDSSSTNKFDNGLFGNDNVWKVMTDPIDSSINQVDKVSVDDMDNGSIWPIVFRKIKNEKNIPIAIIPVAKGGTSITQWQKNYDAKSDGYNTNLYSNMLDRIKKAGSKIRGVIWWQGENDARLNMQLPTYFNNLNELASNIKKDLNVPIVVAQIGEVSKAPIQGILNVRNAQSNSWNKSANILKGPSLAGINLSDAGGDGIHFIEDNDVKVAADRWAVAIINALYK